MSLNVESKFFVRCLNCLAPNEFTVTTPSAYEAEAAAEEHINTYTVELGRCFRNHRLEITKSKIVSER